MQLNDLNLIHASAHPLGAFLHSQQLAGALSDLQVLTLSGKDAVSFLHSQLTIDIQNLPNNQAAFGAYCTAKGRVICTLLVVKVTDSATKEPLLHILVHATMAEVLAKKLKMFILRSKVTLSLSNLQVYGVILPDSSQVSATNFAVTTSNTDELIWIAAPSLVAGTKRWWVLSPSASDLKQENANTALELCQTIAAAQWLEYDAICAYFWTTQLQSEQFIPQTLNLDCINAVHFKKGCYPGQEIVARTHYLGKIKRRMVLGFIADHLPSAEDKTYTLESNSEIAAEVIAWFTPGANYQWALIETTLDIPASPLALTTTPYPIILVPLGISYEKPLP